MSTEVKIMTSAYDLPAQMQIPFLISYTCACSESNWIAQANQIFSNVGVSISTVNFVSKV